MKKLGTILGILMLCWGLSVSAAAPMSQMNSTEVLKGQERASTENIETLRKKIIELKSLKATQSTKVWDNCGHEPPPPYTPPATCVPNCTWRSSSGSCLSYGSDFCGPNASCSPNCTWRSSSGECLSYGADICY